MGNGMLDDRYCIFLQLIVMAEDYIPPVSQPHQHKVLIYNASGQLGHRLVEYFRNDHEIEVNPNVILGTLAPQEHFTNDLGLTIAIDVPASLPSLNSAPSSTQLFSRAISSSSPSIPPTRRNSSTCSNVPPKECRP